MKWRRLETLLFLLGLPIFLVVLSQSLLLLNEAVRSFTVNPSSSASVTTIPKNASSCYTDACILREAALLARVWKQRPRSEWCAPKTNNNTSLSNAVNASRKESGLILVKVPKSASSTVSGMALQLAHEHGCTVAWQHRRARSIGLDASASFVLAPVRHAHTRALSSVYFHRVALSNNKNTNRQQANVSQQSQVLPTDAFIINRLEETQANYILDYMRPTADNTSTTPMQNEPRQDSNIYHQDVVASILNHYDFLMVVERMDESLVVLSWLTHTNIHDWLTLTNSKQAGSWYFAKTKCVRLIAPHVTTTTTNYFNSKEWRRKHAGDALLHAAAELSLDQTIQHIGAERVARGVRDLQTLRRRVQTYCQNQSVLPCSDQGQVQIELSKTSCYERDFGCGYPCVNAYIKTMYNNKSE
jgi:hypothetical protein